MSDMINSRKLTDLHPHMMNLCKQHIANCAKRGVYIIVTDVMRSDDYQSYLYEQGRSRDGNIVTWTKTTYAHGMYEYEDEYKSMAYDVAPLTDDKKNTDYGNRAKWKVIIEEGKKLGLEHGTEVFGKSDDPHWQLVEGLTKAELRDGERPSYWNKEVKPNRPKPQLTPIEILASKNIINDTSYWKTNCVKGKVVDGDSARALINNFYYYKSGEHSIPKAIDYLFGKKIITDVAQWNKIVNGGSINGEFMAIVLDRMSKDI